MSQKYYRPKAIGLLRADSKNLKSSHPVFSSDPLSISTSSEYLGNDDKTNISELDIIIGDSKELQSYHNDSAFQAVADMMPVTLVTPVNCDISESSPANGNDCTAPWGIEAIDAHKSELTGEGVSVAILDTGINPKHEAFLDPRLRLVEKNFSSTPTTQDQNGHGTHCAATIFGRPVCDQRIGVAPGITHALIGKVFDDQGHGTTESIILALDWAYRHKADIVSMSFELDFISLASQLEYNYAMPKPAAISYAIDTYMANVKLFDALAARFAAQELQGRGCLLIAAAGNKSARLIDSPYTISTGPPASCDSIIAVGAIEKTLTHPSGYTVAPFSNTNVDVCAPGVDISSAKLGGGCNLMSGTSMATPHVAGVAALWGQMMLEINGKLTAKQLRAYICGQTKPLGGHNINDVGGGLVQAPK